MVKSKRIASVFSILLTLPLTFGGIVSAQAQPAAPAAGSTAAQRLDQRKKERNIQLSDQDQRRLQQTCTNAIGKIRALQSTTNTMFDTRTKVYQQIDGKLWIAIGQLKLAGQDTFELEKRRAILADKISTFQTNAQNYRQTLDDIVVLNCAADVVGFRALLDTARLYHTQLETQAKDIRTYLVDNIKTKLSEHATDLQPKSDGGQ